MRCMDVLRAGKPRLYKHTQALLGVRTLTLNLTLTLTVTATVNVTVAAVGFSAVACADTCAVAVAAALDLGPRHRAKQRSWQTGKGTFV